jgi:hypothetical protein
MSPRQTYSMGMLAPRLAITLVACAALVASCQGSKAGSSGVAMPTNANGGAAAAHVYLGFDRNDYPGDEHLAELRKTFAFTGYWLTPPPNEKRTDWLGKREKLNAAGFGFLLLANGKLYKQLGNERRAALLGKQDSARAVELAKSEGFPAGTVIFVDQEQGGKMLPEQLDYLLAWFDGVSAGGYRAGVYCSGLAAPQPDGSMVVTSEDIRAHSGGRQISYWVYNDFCPPAPGCVFASPPPAPSGSGTPFAEVWQIAESPLVKERIAKCASTYDTTAEVCWAPNLKAAGIYVDVDTATTADPSHGRK